MTPRRHAVRRAIDLSCVLGLVSLGLMTLSVLVPRPVPVFLAMTVGQVIGTLSLAMFLVAVLVDARIVRPTVVESTGSETVTDRSEKVPQV